MLTRNDIMINDAILEYIVEKYTDNENGVRNFKRVLETIFTKINLLRLIKPDNNILKLSENFKVELPITITKNIVDKLVVIPKINSPPFSMYL